MATYSAEPAKSSRATCKKCKDKINKDDLRIGTHRVTADDITMTSWVHAKCFSLPKKFDVDTFFRELNVTDADEEQMEQFREMLSKPLSSPKRKSIGGANDAGSKKARLEHELEGMPEAEREVFLKYKAKTIDELKDFLRWNGQLLSGTKGELVNRCVDGDLHGALPHCPEPGCKGRLRIEGSQVHCGGAFDDEVGTFVRCYFKVAASAVTRVPWRTGPKSEEEAAVDATFQVTVNTSKAAALFQDLDMGTVEGKKTAVSRFVDLAREEGINVPENDQEARVKLGTLLMNNPSLTGAELLAQAEEKLGTRKSSQEKVQRSAVGTVVPENTGIVTALSELSTLYLKTGNAQAGNTYRKAAAAIRQYTQVVTSGRAISRGKGKVDGIGEKCGEIIDEFLETGDIAKAAEKRAEVGGG